MTCHTVYFLAKGVSVWYKLVGNSTLAFTAGVQEHNTAHTRQVIFPALTASHRALPAYEDHHSDGEVVILSAQRLVRVRVGVGLGVA